jgi:hypothetical protein
VLHLFLLLQRLLSCFMLWLLQLTLLSRLLLLLWWLL